MWSPLAVSYVQNSGCKYTSAFWTLTKHWFTAGDVSRSGDFFWNAEFQIFNRCLMNFINQELLNPTFDKTTALAKNKDAQTSYSPVKADRSFGCWHDCSLTFDAWYILNWCYRNFPLLKRNNIKRFTAVRKSVTTEPPVVIFPSLIADILMILALLNSISKPYFQIFRTVSHEHEC